MLNALKQLFASKKWLAVLGGVMTSVGAALTGSLGWKEAVFAIIGLIVTGITGQAIADAGKEKAKIESGVKP